MAGVIAFVASADQLFTLRFYVIKQKSSDRSDQNTYDGYEFALYHCMLFTDASKFISPHLII